MCLRAHVKCSHIVMWCDTIVKRSRRKDRRPNGLSPVSLSLPVSVCCWTPTWTRLYDTSFKTRQKTSYSLGRVAHDNKTELTTLYIDEDYVQRTLPYIFSNNNKVINRWNKIVFQSKADHPRTAYKIWPWPWPDDLDIRTYRQCEDVTRMTDRCDQTHFAAFAAW